MLCKNIMNMLICLTHCLLACANTTGLLICFHLEGKLWEPGGMQDCKSALPLPEEHNQGDNGCFVHCTSSCESTEALGWAIIKSDNMCALNERWWCSSQQGGGMVDGNHPQDRQVLCTQWLQDKTTSLLIINLNSWHRNKSAHTGMALPQWHSAMSASRIHPVAKERYHVSMCWLQLYHMEVHQFSNYNAVLAGLRTQFEEKKDTSMWFILKFYTTSTQHHDDR